MSDGRFGISQPYHQDPGAELQRLHREREAKAARIDRAVAWLGRHVTGTYHSLDALTFAACAVTVTVLGRGLEADEHEVIVSACRVIFAGLSAIGCRIKTDERGQVAYVVFPKAA